jgi:hypothetical protein
MLTQVSQPEAASARGFFADPGHQSGVAGLSWTNIAVAGRELITVAAEGRACCYLPTQTMPYASVPTIGHRGPP